jgi:cell wall-associated NlpC family hydrolase
MLGGTVLSATAALVAAALPATPAAAATTAPATVTTSAAIQPIAATTSTAQTTLQMQQKRAAYAVKYAYKQIGDPYRYGGTGPGSWDCSGLSQAAWRKGGVSLPRTTHQQWAWGANRRVSMDSLRPGDLIFSRGLGHMGIYIGDGKMLHAPQTGDVVKITPLSRYGHHRFLGGIRP